MLSSETCVVHDIRILENRCILSYLEDYDTLLWQTISFAAKD
jgi:hypothetical protein